ncbi:hypothetical protein ABBQ32_005963 [Trebouxia sp. C0010 RCD-2024]
MLPLLLLKTAQGHPVLVELKSGETYNGHMVQCDSWMNVHLREVICTSKDGDRFWRMPEAYIRGNTIKYLRVPDEVIDKVRDDSYNRAGSTGCHKAGKARSDLWEAQEVGAGGVVGLVEEMGLEDEGEREALVLLVGEKVLPAIEGEDEIISCGQQSALSLCMTKMLVPPPYIRRQHSSRNS